MIKKYVVKLLLGAVALAVALSFFACNDSENETDNIDNDTESEEYTDITNENESDTDAESESEPEEGCYHPYASTSDGHWKPACDVCGKPSGSIQSHDFTEYAEDEGDLIMYSSYCKVCEYVAYEQEVPYDVNLFYSSGELNKAQTQSLNSSYGYDNSGCFVSYKSDVGAGVVYVAQKGDLQIKSGSIMAMKVRIPASQSSMTVAIKSLSAKDSYTINIDYLESGWVTVIIDLSKAVMSTYETDPITGEQKEVFNGYAPDAIGDFYLEHCALGSKVGDGESFDVSWVLFCDTLDVAQDFVATEKRISIYRDVVNEAPEVIENPCIDENGNEIEHKISADEHGHTIESSCDQCGLVATENEPHVFVQTMIGNSMTYACKICLWQQFGGNVSKYITAAEINNSACTYYKINVSESPLNENGMEYAHFSGQGTTAQVLFARNNSVSTPAEKAASFGVGQAKYFVIKMRASDADVSRSRGNRGRVGYVRCRSFRTDPRCVRGASERKIYDNAFLSPYRLCRLYRERDLRYSIYGVL